METSRYGFAKIGIILTLVAFLAAGSAGVTRSVDSVTINDLPEEETVGQSLTITGDAQGSGLTQLSIAHRDDGDTSWHVIESTNCGDSSSCDLTASYSPDSTGTQEFQVKAEAGGVSDESSIEEVSFVEDTGNGGTGTCDIETGFLSFGDTEIDDSGSTNADITVYNDGSDQDVRVTFKAEGDRIQRNTRTVDGGDSRTFSATLDADHDDDNDGEIRVQAIVETRDGPCGDDEVSRKTGYVSVTSTGDSGGTDEDPVARLDISPEPAETGETITFDARDSNDPDGGDIQQYKFDFDDDGDWDETDYDGRVTRSFDSTFERYAKVKVWDNEDDTDTDREFYRVVSDTNGGDSCDLSSGFLNFDSPEIESGDSTTARITVYNHGDNQDVRVTFKADGDRISRTTRNIDADDSREFTATIQSSQDDNGDDDVDVTTTVETRNGPCGDDTSSTKTGTVDITGATETNNNPDAQFDYTPSNPTSGETVEFEGGVSSDPDNDITSYEWDFDDGSTASGSNVQHSFDNSGEYNVELSVTDSNGNTDTRTRTVTVAGNGGGAPEECSISTGFLNFDSDNIESGDSTTARITVYNNGDNQDVRVTFKADGDRIQRNTRTVDAGDSREFTATINSDHDDNSDDDVDVEAKVETRDGPCGDDVVTTKTDTVDIVETASDNNDPDADFDYTPSNPAPGDTVEFDATSSSDPDSDITSYEWDFGDGSTASGSNVQHSFDSSGDYDVELNVTDSNGNSDTLVRTVSVSSGGGTGTQECRINAGFLSFDDTKIDEDGSTTARIEVYNNGDDQDVEVEFRADGDSVKTESRQIDSGSSSVFTADVDGSDDDDGDGRIEVEAVVRTKGDACGDDTVSTHDGTIDINGLESDQNQGDGELSVFVEDRNGNDLQDARVRVENGETEVEYTDSNGKADFFLEEGWYDVTVSKSGYETETRDVRVNEDEETVIRLGLDSSDSTGDNGDEAGLDITDVDYPNSVCEGGSFTADITIENRGGFHEVVTVSGSGLGSITIGNSFTMEEGDTKTRSLRFTNVEGTGTEQFDITATNHDSDSTSRSIKVRDCPVDASREPVQEDTETFQASGMTMQLEPDRVRIGEALKVSGYVDGPRGRSKVRITINGDDAGRVNTQPDGYFQTFIRPESVGELTVTATAGSARNSRKLEVLPTANVVYAQSPQKVFEGEQFEVCGQVESQVTPTVYLEKDDQIVASKNAKGEVCFQRNATGTGDHRYDVIALARGAKNVATTNTEVLEAGSETESFPDKVVSVESGSGLVKVELYNTHNELRRYHLSLEEVPDSWVSQSEKEVLLSKGERKTVYFYLTPKDEGDFTGQLKVETGGSTIFQEDVRINSGGTTEPQGGFLQGLLEGLGLRL